jgi:cyclopropane fatty-acyl-phospholipid synthase-like methyltransferase
VLDIGCGTGGIARALWLRGYRVTGIDNNARMIEEARERLRTVANQYGEKQKANMPQFMVLDMRRIGEQFAEGAFDSLLSLGNTLVHLSSPEEIEEFFRGAHGVLRSGGRMLLQILNYDYILDERITRLPLIETQHHRFHRRYEFDDDAGLIKFRGVLEEQGSGMRIESVTRLYPLRSRQLKELLNAHGFAVQSEYGSYSYGPAGGKRLPYIVTARKKRKAG